MVTFKLTEKQSVQFPTSYRELTMGQFIDLRHFNGRVPQLLEILSIPSIPASVWEGQPADIDYKLGPAISWVVEDAINFDEIPMPEKITIDGIEIEIPKDLGYKTFGQKSLADERVRSCFSKTLSAADEKLEKYSIQKDFSTVMPYVAAIYLQPFLNDGKFDEEQAVKVEDKLLNMTAYEIYPIATFFLRNLIGSLKFGRNLTQQEKARLAGRTRKKPVSKKSKRSGHS